MEHPYAARYRSVWEATLATGELTPEQVAKSQFYFEPDLATPRMFDTYGMVALMPMAADAQELLSRQWAMVMRLLDSPRAYAVEPANRHVELLLFSRPEEETPEAARAASIRASYEALKAAPLVHLPLLFAALS